MGFSRCIFPKTGKGEKLGIKGIELIRVEKLQDFLDQLF
jgi:hypothetical protein